jgi:SAM-dependent methyltransferase
MATNVANVEMAAAWDGEEGDDWAREWRRYDRAVVGYHEALIAAAAPEAAEHVLDIGCGTGQATRDAARKAPDGRALGADLSSRMIDRAREVAIAEGVANASFEQADVQVHRFDRSAFDLAISRFGAMFFGDPIAAFANVATSLRPGGRLAIVTWRPLADNEWLQCVFAALAVGRELPSPPPGAPGPFGLADPALARDRLRAAGFDSIDITPVDHPVLLGSDGDDAFEFIASTGVFRGMTGSLDDADRARAIDALHATMDDHDTGRGVEFGAAGWLIRTWRPER